MVQWPHLLRLKSRWTQGSPRMLRQGGTWRTPGAIMVVMLYVLVWWGPSRQLQVLPEKRAETFVALTICQRGLSSPTQVSVAQLTQPPPRVSTHTAAQIADLATPFVPVFGRDWRLEMAAALLAAAALLGTLRRWAVWPLLALAGAAAFIYVHPVGLDSYRLVLVTGLIHWFKVVGSWDIAMICQLLLLPVALGLLVLHALWPLLKVVVRAVAGAGLPGLAKPLRGRPIDR